MRPIRKIVSGLLLLLILLVLAGCGGDKKEDQPTAQATAPAFTAGPTPTLPTRTPLPPTWTPVPTLTEPPRVTIDYEYQRPTVATFIPPTYTASPSPTPGPPTATPTGPVIIITAAALDQAIAAQTGPEALTFIQAPPQVAFEENKLLISLNVLSVPGNTESARPVMIEVSVTVNPSQGNIVVSKIAATYRDDNTPFTLPLADQLIVTMQTVVDETLVQLYSTASPDIPRFYVSEVLIASSGIT
ncbi:MAG: hypothetical protein HY866_06435, partial [Chloroflexi bacterium]|nr:hypothetical protein [Chloroflexota bacterium]